MIVPHDWTKELIETMGLIILVQEPVENANEANSEADEDNESSRPKTNKKLGIDYFNNQETDLKKTGAMSKYFDIAFFLWGHFLKSSDCIMIIC